MGRGKGETETDGWRNGERWENEQHTGARRRGREASSHRASEARREAQRAREAPGDRHPPPSQPCRYLSAMVAFPKQELVLDDALLPWGAP